ncbi:hypothetical protein GGI10_000675 [Coemansia sp. RSA 2530]|nr:hypothetical protein GGI10_000675 [Coemansia sp. RSA 2530]
MTVIPLALAKALSDKLYDKQRAATHKVERLVLDALDNDDEHLIYELIAELATDYATSEKEASRIGGLVALAATAVALTHINIRPFLPQMVPPMVSALSDGESKVRYFACESLYNVAKVSRGQLLRWFNDIFDGLARVTSDSVKTVKDGADYLDRLVKDIVAEQAATCLDWYDGDEGPRLAFGLDRFVPLLAERMHTYKPSTRVYLIEWVRVLDSVPGLDLIGYLPEFLDGLVRFLSDPNDDVRNKTQSLLGELLAEIRECVDMQGVTDDDVSGRMRSFSVQGDVSPVSRRPSRAPSAAGSIPASARLGAQATATAAVTQHHHYYQRPGSRLGLGSEAVNRSTVSLMTSALAGHGMSEELRMAARRKKIRAERLALVNGGLVAAGSMVAIDFGRCVDILVPHLESNDQEIQGLALGWIYQFTWLCPDVMVRCVPRLVNAVLPSVSHPMPALRHTAEDVSHRLYDLVAEADSPRRHCEPLGRGERAVSPEAVSEGVGRSRTNSVLQNANSPVASDDDVSEMEAIGGEAAIDEPFNYEQAATAVMELFAKNVHEPTKVAGMRWLLLLHGKAPWRILTPEDMSFPVLLKMLSDGSEHVVKLDLELFAQISLYSQGESPGEPVYLLRFLGSLLQMFATDRVLLETRAALMVRQLCVVLDPQLVFCLFARLLNVPRFSAENGYEEEEGLADLEFISVMVQHLSWILVTAPETEPLRLLLREYNAELAVNVPSLSSIRDVVAKDSLVRRERGASLSPSNDAEREGGDSPVHRPTKLARPPVRGGRVPAPSVASRSSRNSVTDADKPRPGRPMPPLPQKRRQAELAALGVRGRSILANGLQRMELSVERSRMSHELFSSLFRAWSHNPAACLTLCLLSQHYAVASQLVTVFGSLTHDLTVSFLVQLDKLVQLVESPVFTYLRLQLLDPARHPELVRTLYGLLMLLPQSSAFAILRNRLSTIAMPGGVQFLSREALGQSVGDQQVHYHYHQWGNPAAEESGAVAGLLSGATGVAEAEVAELLRLLAVLAVHSDAGEPSAAGVLQMAADLQQAEPPGDDGRGSAPEDVANDAARFVEEYRAVRGKYARALAHSVTLK